MIASVDRLFIQPAQHDPLGVQRSKVGMSDGNGADIGQVMAMLQDVLAMQRDTRLEVTGLRLELGEVRQGLRTLDRRVDDLAGQVASLRQDVAAYHASVVGHGILIGEIEGRVSRIEQHLDLPPAAV